MNFVVYQFQISLLTHFLIKFVPLPQVIVGQIMGNGQVSTKHLGTHRGRVHKLAIEPGSPHIFYSCGEDGLVQHVCPLFHYLYFFPPLILSCKC